MESKEENKLKNMAKEVSNYKEEDSKIDEFEQEKITKIDGKSKPRLN